MTGMLITVVGLVDEPDDHASFATMLEQAKETTGGQGVADPGRGSCPAFGVCTK